VRGLLTWKPSRARPPRSRSKASSASGGLFSNGDSRADATESSGFTPRVMASYEVNDGVRLNAQAAQGFRLGGVKVRSSSKS
jgi:outer membrane receptor protein involved in Fe transport